MNLGENIHNAVVVLQNTYENIKKLMDYCQSQKDSDFVPAVQKFLRFKSDNETRGWLINFFILLFQNKNDRMLKNGWRKGPVYVMEINIEDEVEPQVYLARFDYEDISRWSPGCSPASFWAFYYPLRREEMEQNMNKEMGVTILTPRDSSKDYIINTYWGLTKISYIKYPLVSITAENVQETIFGSFELLKSL